MDLKETLNTYGKQNPDGSWDVDGDVKIRESDLIDGHFPVRFREVNGNFYCYDCNEALAKARNPNKSSAKPGGRFKNLEIDDDEVTEDSSKTSYVPKPSLRWKNLEMDSERFGRRVIWVTEEELGKYRIRVIR